MATFFVEKYLLIKKFDFVPTNYIFVPTMKNTKRIARTKTCKIRCTDSFLEIIKLQQANYFYSDFSISDIIHEAVAIKAQKEIEASEQRDKLYRDIIDSI